MCEILRFTPADLLSNYEALLAQVAQQDGQGADGQMIMVTTAGKEGWIRMLAANHQQCCSACAGLRMIASFRCPDFGDRRYSDTRKADLAGLIMTADPSVSMPAEVFLVSLLDLWIYHIWVCNICTEASKSQVEVTLEPIMRDMVALHREMYPGDLESVPPLVRGDPSPPIIHIGKARRIGAGVHNAFRPFLFVAKSQNAAVILRSR